MHGISVQFSVSFGYPFEGYDGEQNTDESKSHEHTLDSNVCIHEAGQLKGNEILVQCLKSSQIHEKYQPAEKLKLIGKKLHYQFHQ